MQWIKYLKISFDVRGKIMKNLLDAISEIRFDDWSLMEAIKTVIEERISWLEYREPEYDGAVHDEWDEKIDALNEILDEINDMKDSVNDTLDNINDLISDYQMIYGGLSRLKIDI